MLSDTEIEFIEQHAAEDAVALLLHQHRYPDLDLKKLAQQIIGRQKARYKLPDWAAHPSLFFPPSQAWQQTSSQLAAQYKTNLLTNPKGTLVDLTGGFGVDAYYLSRGFNRVVYCEQQPDLAQIAAYNFGQLKAKNIEVYQGDGLYWLAQNSEPIDAIYLDPARRNPDKRQIITLEDSSPNMLEIQSELLEKTKIILLKASPMLDLHQALRQLAAVMAVHIVAIDNDLKEVLFYIKKTDASLTTPRIVCVHLQSEKPNQIFETHWEPTFQPSCGILKQYLYDPNVAIRKAGLYGELALQFGLEKLHPNTHLFTSETLHLDFPGRVFSVEKIIKPSKKSVQLGLKLNKANLAVRNFGESVAELRKKWNLKDGGDDFLFAATLFDERKVVIHARKLF